MRTWNNIFYIKLALYFILVKYQRYSHSVYYIYICDIQCVQHYTSTTTYICMLYIRIYNHAITRWAVGNKFLSFIERILRFCWRKSFCMLYSTVCFLLYLYVHCTYIHSYGLTYRIHNTLYVGILYKHVFYFMCKYDIWCEHTLYIQTYDIYVKF